MKIRFCWLLGLDLRAQGTIVQGVGRRVYWRSGIDLAFRDRGLGFRVRVQGQGFSGFRRVF